MDHLGAADVTLFGSKGNKGCCNVRYHSGTHNPKEVNKNTNSKYKKRLENKMGPCGNKINWKKLPEIG
jgi:hypothetical protein